MIYFLYTDSKAIIAALGMREADIDEAILNDQDLEGQMTLALTEIFPTHETAGAAYDTLLSLWCMWFGAQRIAESPYAVLKQFSTGKDLGIKYDIDWAALAKRCAEEREKLENKFPEASADAFSFISIATPAYDPITGS